MSPTDALALALVHSGRLTLAEVAARFGIPASTLVRWCKQAGFDHKRQRALHNTKWVNIGIRNEWKLPQTFTRRVRTRRKNDLKE